MPLRAQEHTQPPETTCDQNESIGSVFYNFDEIILLYVTFPLPEDENSPEYPRALTFETFNTRLLNAIRHNFARCLKTPIGMEKPIVVIPPSSQKGGSRELKALGIDRDHIHNQKHLTIAISVSYKPGHLNTIGVEEYGQASFFIYRPDIAYKAARIPSPNNSGMLTFFPRRGDAELTQQLDYFFSGIRPHKAGGFKIRSLTLPTK